MIVRAREFPDAQGRYAIFEAAPGGVAADADGVRSFYLDESVNTDLCKRLLTRTGAFFYAEVGGAFVLHEDTDWQPEGM